MASASATAQAFCLCVESEWKANTWLDTVMWRAAGKSDVDQWWAYAILAPK
jgi:hypothetical protein